MAERGFEVEKTNALGATTRWKRDERGRVLESVDPLGGRARVQRDIDTGNAAQINHTPTFFVNLTQIPNPTGLAQFEQIINEALASSSAATTTTAE